MNAKLETISNLFEGNEIRSIWDSEKEDYYFSVVDVISSLTNSKIPKRYWSDLKRKLTEEGSQLYENIVQLKVKAQDGKLREIATRELAKKHKPYGLEQNKAISRRGGKIAKNTRDDLEKELEESIITNKNTLKYQYVENSKQKEDKSLLL